MENDEIYRKDQKEAHEIWLDNNPDYWEKYRCKNLKYTEDNRKKQHDRNQKAKSTTKPILKSIAKLDALTHKNTIISGRYELVPIKSDMIAKLDALIVEINTISQGYVHSNS